ncbi:hypothetical protein EAF00_006247 [Botryotinia globosa]|nr:hypothetical protein EAF00_006247 [Botryotinia globosa]
MSKYPSHLEERRVNVLWLKSPSWLLNFALYYLAIQQPLLLQLRMYGPSDAAQATCCPNRQCPASSYGTVGIGLRAAKSLTTSMGNKISINRMLTQVIFM